MVWQAIYKAHQSSFLLSTVGSFSDLHCGLWGLLTVLHCSKGRSTARVKLEGKDFYIATLIMFGIQLHNAKYTSLKTQFNIISV